MEDMMTTEINKERRFEVQGDNIAIIDTTTTQKVEITSLASLNRQKEALLDQVAELDAIIKEYELRKAKI